MIQNLDKIEHPELRDNILKLRNDVIESFAKEGFDTNGKLSAGHQRGDIKNIINKLLYKYVIGVGVPITISDSFCDTSTTGFCIELCVDYRVTYGYKPYQTLDNPIHLFFKIDKSDIRDHKLNNTLNGR